MGKSKHKAEYGDFQTPLELARDACRLLANRGLKPASIVEPTCGKGSFLAAAAECFEDFQVHARCSFDETTDPALAHQAYEVVVAGLARSEQYEVLSVTIFAVGS